ncbi:unnamed protein product [Musa hybrid cultivar]
MCSPLIRIGVPTMCNTFRELYLSWDVVFRKICHGSLFCQRSFRGSFSSDKVPLIAIVVTTSLLSSQSYYWNVTHTDELVNLSEHANSGEVWLFDSFLPVQYVL